MQYKNAMQQYNMIGTRREDGCKDNDDEVDEDDDCMPHATTRTGTTQTNNTTTRTRMRTTCKTQEQVEKNMRKTGGSE